MYLWNSGLICNAFVLWCHGDPFPFRSDYLASSCVAVAAAVAAAAVGDVNGERDYYGTSGYPPRKFKYKHTLKTTPSYESRPTILATTHSTIYLSLLFRHNGCRLRYTRYI